MNPLAADVCTPDPPSRPDGSPLSFPPEWLTEPVRSLAHGIHADDAFDIMPILADALEETGCDDPKVLNHCRFCEHHRPDCWVIERILPLDQLYWTGEMKDRLATAVAANQWHPDDSEAEADRQQANRDRAVARMVWGCAAVVILLLVCMILKDVFHL